MADQARPFPYVWASWLSGLLAGEKQCKYAGWVKAHYKHEKRPDAEAGRLAVWKGEHSDFISAIVLSLRAEGWSVSVEDQNKFTVKGTTADLGCGPDIVATRDDTTLIVDAKTGAANAAHVWQVAIYMRFLPDSKTSAVAGSVWYRTGEHVEVELTEAMSTRIVQLIRELAQPLPLDATPSANECARCDIASCHFRVDAPVATVTTGDF